MARYIDREKVCEKCNNKNYCEKEKCPVYKVPTADVVPKSEVERLEEKCAILNEKNAQLALALFRDFPTTKELEVWEACKAVKTKVAREIFEEIDLIVLRFIPLAGDKSRREIEFLGYMLREIAELKKKYTDQPIDNAERCVVCGEVIPEGRQVCPMCEKQNTKSGLSPAEVEHEP